MNDGVGAGVGLLKRFFHTSEKVGKTTAHGFFDDLFELVKKYGEAFESYLGALSEDERKKFLGLAGVKVFGTVSDMEKKLLEKSSQILTQMA